MKLLPCPFCGGPPAHFRQKEGGGYLAVPTDFGDDGIYVCAFVFCHECGAQSEKAEDASACDVEDVKKVDDEGARLWNLRDRRHSDLYESNDRHGNNLYPRQSGDHT